MEDLYCSKCSPEDHDNKYFCRCEDRNIRLAKELREKGILPWTKPDHIDVFAETEEEFVDLCLYTQRPCTVWQKSNLNRQKIDEIFKERGIFLLNTNIDGSQEAICLPQGNPSSDQVQDLKTLRIKWQEKV
jgi:hypothetical protein